MRGAGGGRSYQLIRDRKGLAIQHSLTSGKDLPVQTGRGVTRDAKVFDLINTDARCAQAVSNRLRRKTRAVLDAIKAFFFNRRDQLAVANDRRRRIAVICVYAEDVHSSSSAF